MLAHRRKGAGDLAQRFGNRMPLRRRAVIGGGKGPVSGFGYQLDYY
jgi:hypothetical protein